MVIDPLKIIYLGTPDDDTGLTGIAKGLQEIFKNNADVVYVQSAEISELFAETRRIMGLMFNPDLPNVNDECKSFLLRCDAEQKIKATFKETEGIYLDLTGDETEETVNVLEKLDHQGLDDLKNLFQKLANLYPHKSYLANMVEFRMREQSERSFLHQHLKQLFDSAEMLFAVSEDPKLTTRIVQECSIVGRFLGFSNFTTVPAPQDALILMRNGGHKPNPVHGTPEKPSNRFTFLVTVSPV